MNEKRIREVEKHLRQSRNALPVLVGIVAISSLTLWLVRAFTPIPIWLTVVIVGMPLFTLVGDLINIALCSAKLKAARGGDAG